MAVNFLHKRSNTANKRPTAANLDIGELALNYEGGDPGVYFEDDNGDVRKVGPITVGGTAPNATPATGGSSGNSVGEGWLDTSGTDTVLKIWDGTSWTPAFGGTVSAELADGEIFVGNASNETEADAFNDVLTAQAGIDGSATTSTQLTLTNSLATFGVEVQARDVTVDDGGVVELRELTTNGTNFIALKAPDSVTADTTFTLPDGDGTSGQSLVTDGSGTLSWASTAGTPGGADTQVQFNNAGSFDGDANFTFNAADDILSVTEVNGRLDGAVIFIAESGEALSAGDVVYVSGVSGNLPVVSKAQANSSTTMPAFGLVQDAAGASGTEVRVTTFGDFTNFDTSTPGWSLGDTLYVSAATAGELTNSAPAGESNLIQNIGKVGRVSSSVGRIKVGGAGRTNATPNLDSGNFFLGNASNQAATVSMSGDATMDNAGAVTIANDAVTTVKILDANVTGAKIEDSVALAGSPTTTTQSAGTNNTTIATTAYVDTASGTKLDTTLNDTQIFVGNGSNVATGVAMSGDATIANTGALTIANDAVTTAKILDDNVTGDKIADDVALAGNPTTTTQTAGDNSTRIATTAYVDTAAGAKLDPALTSAQIFVGNASNVATGVAMSGDTTIDNTGAVTIANDAVTTVKILDANVTGAKIETDVALAGNPTTTTQADTDNSTRIATTAYVRTRVDNALQGLDSKQSVRAASTGNLTLSGTQTVDGVALSAGDRILVKDQTAAEDNGIYVVAAGAWSRSDDTSTWDELVGAFTFVESGTTNADTGWVTQTVAGGTLGTDAIPWVQFSSAGQVTAGAGLTKTGSQIDVGTADSSRIVVNANDIDLATTGVTGGTYQSVTVDTYGRITAGTNPTTFAGYNISDTSANLASAITDETGTGSLVFAGSPALTGTPTAPTQTAGDNSTAIATTAYADAAVGSKLDTTLNSAQVFVGNGSNVATGVALSGDATIDNTGALTIANDAVTTAKILNDNVTGDKIADDVALAGNPTTTTQTAGTNNTTIATTAYADTAVANIAGTYVDVAGDAMTGNLTMNAQSEIRFADADSSNYVAFEAPATVSADVTFVLPDSDGSANQVLTTDGSANLSWTTVSGGGSNALNNGDIFVGNASNVATGVTMSGDVTIDNTGATTIANSVALGGSPTTTTQTAGTNDTTIATTAFVATAVTSGSVSLNSGEILVGDASNVAQGVTPSGDVTFSNTGVTTIANDAVTTAKIINDAVTGDKIADNVALAGNPTTTTQTAGTNDTTIATTAYTDTAVANIAGTYVDVAGDTMTGPLVLDDTTLQIEEGTDTLTLGAPALAASRTVNFQDADGDIALVGAGSVDTRYSSSSLNSANILVGNASNVATSVTMSGDVGIDNTGATTIANDVALAGNPTTTTQTAGNNSTRIATTAYADAAVTASKALNSADIFVGNASNVATGVTMSGDATIDNAGALTIANDAVTSAKIANDTIVDADINSAAAISHSKLANITAASILVGNSTNVPTVTAVSGDVTLSDTGVVDIIDDVNLGGNPTTTTQADTDDSTRIATTAFVQNRVDIAIQGLSSKDSVVAASTGNLTLSGTQTVDGQALVAGDRILVKDQTNSEENGIYEVASGAWSRTGDANTWDEIVGAFVFVEAGTVNASTGFTTTILAGGTLGTDPIPWVQFSSAGQVSAGAGLTKTGSTLDVVTADSSRIVVNSNDIDLATTGIAAGTYRSVTIDTYGRATAGTNPTTFAGYGISDTSANLASVITDETGTGSLVFASSPALAGTPTAPTATAGDNSTTIATTAYTDSAVATLSAAVQWENNSGEIRPTTDGRDVVPVTDGGASLGTSSLRWANVYTQDMHFSNEGTSGNSVDGTTGDWTLQEGADDIYMINNKTGKKFRISMEAVD